MNIHQAQLVFDQHGLVTIINGDARSVSIYDDEDDAAVDWPIEVWMVDWMSTD